MKNRNERKQFTFLEIKSFLNADIKRKLRIETVEITVATTTSTFSSRSFFRQGKNRHVKKIFRSFSRSRYDKKYPRSLFRHEKKNRPTSFLATYSRIIKSVFFPSQFYQQQSFESTFESTFATDFAIAFVTDAFVTTNFAHQSFSSNSNMPRQFQQSVAYNPFSFQSIGPAAPPQQ